eukprot:COSAG05_NODE_300_length_11883_cov_12.913357_15_plen_56_part_00
MTVHLVELVKIEGTSWFSSREITVRLECVSSRNGGSMWAGTGGGGGGGGSGRAEL